MGSAFVSRLFLGHKAIFDNAKLPQRSVILVLFAFLVFFLFGCPTVASNSLETKDLTARNHLCPMLLTFYAAECNLERLLNPRIKSNWAARPARVLRSQFVSVNKERPLSGKIECWTLAKILEYHNNSSYPVFIYDANLKDPDVGTLGGFHYGQLTSHNPPLKAGKGGVEDPTEKYHHRKDSDDRVRIAGVTYKCPNLSPNTVGRSRWLWFFLGIGGLYFAVRGIAIAFIGYVSFGAAWADRWLLKGIVYFIAGTIVAHLGFSCWLNT